MKKKKKLKIIDHRQARLEEFGHACERLRNAKKSEVAQRAWVVAALLREIPKDDDWYDAAIAMCEGLDQDKYMVIKRHLNGEVIPELTDDQIIIALKSTLVECLNANNFHNDVMEIMMGELNIPGEDIAEIPDELSERITKMIDLVVKKLVVALSQVKISD